MQVEKRVKLLPVDSSHNALPFLGYASLNGSIIKGFLAYDLTRVKAIWR
jgi:1-deoxy-D-xylulose 5-phosphate reductoisomerase